MMAGPIELEARENDPPAANRFANLRPEEQARYLQDAERNRLRVLQQEREANRPLTEAEADQVQTMASVRLIDELGARLLNEVSADPPGPLLIDRLDLNVGLCPSRPE